MIKIVENKPTNTPDKALEVIAHEFECISIILNGLKLLSLNTEWSFNEGYKDSIKWTLPR